MQFRNSELSELSRFLQSRGHSPVRTDALLHDEKLDGLR
jgi:hypothetical protein